MIEIDPITDGILEEVLGGIGDEDGTSNSCHRRLIQFSLEPHRRCGGGRSV
jgi:hypothetical protein